MKTMSLRTKDDILRDKLECVEDVQFTKDYHDRKNALLPMA